MPYYRGASFAVQAIAGRVPAAREETRLLGEEYDRFLDAVRWWHDQR